MTQHLTRHVHRFVPTLAALATLIIAACVTAAEPAPAPAKLTAEQEAFFESKVRPLLVAKCYDCHSVESGKSKGNLYLDTRAGWQVGGDSGPTIVPGDPDKSPLIRAILYKHEPEMPPKGKLPDDQIAVLTQWVQMGAPDPRDGEAPKPVDHVEIDIEQGRKWWAFSPLANVEPPAVRDTAWPHSDIDSFILAKLESKGVKPVEDADRATLLRRVYFDLIGLPPSPAEIERFASDTSPDAFERVVDRLLSSHHFGERWGRHWLDLARYADSNGSDNNYLFTNAWRYRNWVIDAVNRDVPYDVFVQRQIAGDLMPAESPEQRDRNYIATGYLLFGSKVLNEFDKQQLHMDTIDEIIDVMGQSLLGLTLGCARCHDHKFDPVAQSDYYALAGIFKSTVTLDGFRDRVANGEETDWSRRGLGPGGDEKWVAFKSDMQRKIDWIKSTNREYNARKDVADLEEKLANVGDAAEKRTKLTEELEKKRKELARHEAKLAELNAQLPAEVAMAVRDADEMVDQPICIRGDPHSFGATVPRGFIRVLGYEGQPTIPAEASGRLQLAQWLTSPNNALAVRVAVNRVWHHLFGHGIVRTVDNFGVRGEQPSHPQLLDYLANRFIANGWSMKQLIREVVTSRAYRMSTRHDAAGYKVDPENRLLHRQNRKRLQPEALRDGMLLIADRLDPHRPTSTIVGLGQPMGGVGSVDYPADYRRSVYLPLVRDMLPDVLDTFDFANTKLVTGARPNTTVPPQSLYLLNSPFVIEMAESTAKRIIAAHGASSAQDLEPLAEAAYVAIINRRPSGHDLLPMTTFLGQRSEQADTTTALAELCQALFASSQYQYVD